MTVPPTGPVVGAAVKVAESTVPVAEEITKLLEPSNVTDTAPVPKPVVGDCSKLCKLFAKSDMFVVVMVGVTCLITPPILTVRFEKSLVAGGLPKLTPDKVAV